MTLPKKDLKFVLSKGNGIIVLNLGFMLLPTELGLIVEKEGHKIDAFEIRSTGCVKIVLALLTKVVSFYIQATIVQVEVLEFESPILGGKVCFTIFLALKKQF